MIIKLTEQIEYLLNTLTSAGFQAFAVGGYVRNGIMGIKAGDCDITTSATPNETKKLFSNHTIIETGIKHGTVTVVINHTPYEITTYRTEGEYSDFRHPNSVDFVKDIYTDLSRRDFTVNAIAYNPKTGIIDPYNGISDINKKILRTVGQPRCRFNEDALRILRALRFSSVLGFSIEKNTAAAIANMAQSLNLISSERIYSELKLLLLGKNAREVVTRFYNALQCVIPINGNPDALDKLPYDLPMRLTALCGKDVLTALERLKVDNLTKQSCKLLLNSTPIPLTEQKHKLYISKLGREAASYVAAYRRVIYGEDKSCRTELLLNQENCLSVSELAVKGNDIASLGISGKAVGDILNSLLTLVINGTLDNNKTALLDYIINNINK